VEKYSKLRKFIKSPLASIIVLSRYIYKHFLVL